MADLHPTSQLVARRLDLLRRPRLLVIGYPDDGIGLLLRERLPAVCVTQFHSDYRIHKRQTAMLAAAGYDTNACSFGAWHPAVDEPFDTALLFLPRSGDMADMMLANVRTVLRAEGRVLLVGENKAGIRSQLATLQDSVGSVDTSEAARHCVLYGATLMAGTGTPGSLDDWAMSYEATVNGVSLRVFSFPGMFCQGRLDAGTRFLLENLTITGPSRVLDLGCGSGAVGSWIAARWPESQVDMVDSSALAIEAARRTVQANGLPACRVWPSDICSDVDAKYTCVVTYPPFHAESGKDYLLWERFVREAAEHVEEGGSLVLAAPRHLPCRRVLERYPGGGRLLAADANYEVWESFPAERAES